MDENTRKMRLKLITIRQMEYYEAWEESFKASRSHTAEPRSLTNDEAREALLAILQNRQIKAPS